MAKVPSEIKSLARVHTVSVLKTLAAIAKHSKGPPAARVAACQALLDRGWGKAAQPHTDGEGGPIRHIVEIIDPTRDS